MFSLSGKVAVVTGGAKGIGQAICEVFVNQGATVCLLDIDMDSAADVQAALGCDRYACDVTDYSQWQETARRIAAEHGQIDVLVNNAGTAHIGTVESTTEAEFDRIYEVNVKGVFFGMKAAMPHMRTRGGSIINLASIVSRVGLPDRFAYTMSKGAVAAMTRSVAVDCLPKGIRCNCIMPARVHTPFVDGYLNRYYPGRQDEMFRKLSKAQPIGRMGSAEEVAALACYLASDESAFLTGAALPLDGGVFTLQP
ncbi:MAG: SDR family NAD(P)-dependent oxidoreductase [Bacteroidota bacterium]|nr:SDR family NAD(P)-dependent oxidoreductase [Bacteroidota bacterium]